MKLLVTSVPRVNVSTLLAWVARYLQRATTTKRLYTLTVHVNTPHVLDVHWLALVTLILKHLLMMVLVISPAAQVARMKMLRITILRRLLITAAVIMRVV